MKNLNLPIIYIIISCISLKAQVKIGNNAAMINSDAMLELESASKGFLLPRLPLVAATSPAPLSSFTSGMLVYNTAAGSGITPGIHYSDGVKWIKLETAITLTTAGNSGSATVSGMSLNIPNYTLAGLGGISLSSLSAQSPLSYNSATGSFSLIRKNLLGGTSNASSPNALTLDAGAVNALAGSSDAVISVHNTAPLWNAAKIQGAPVSATAPALNQVLKWNGTNWTPATEAAAINWLITGNSNAVYGTHFLGTTNDVPMTLRSNNTSMLEVGTRQTLGLWDNTSTGLFPYNQQTASVAYIRGSGGNSALQFESSSAAYYRPLFFTDANGNFKMRGSSAGTDFFEIGSAGTSNNGKLDFVTGDDGDEPMTFRKYNYITGTYIEMLRMQGTGLDNTVRTGINVNGVLPNSTLQLTGSFAPNISTAAANITLDDTHFTVILSTNSNVTLPAASTCKGRLYVIKKTAAGNSTISAYVPVNGVGTSTSLLQGVSSFQSDGTNWQRLF